MRSLILGMGMLSLLCGGCAPCYRDTTLYQLSGRQKPIVAVLPVIDNTSGNNLSWELSRELTDEIRKRVFDSRKIYLLRDGGNLEIAHMLSTPNPSAISRSIAEDLGAAEFAVVAEIVEQEEKNYGLARADIDHPKHSDVGAVLTTALRVRVLDLRHGTPTIILQELMDKDYVISRAYMNCDYSKMVWGTEAFTHTPMGIAHSRLVRELVARIEAYIDASQ